MKIKFEIRHKQLEITYIKDSDVWASSYNLCYKPCFYLVRVLHFLEVPLNDSVLDVDTWDDVKKYLSLQGYDKVEVIEYED